MGFTKILGGAKPSNAEVVQNLRIPNHLMHQLEQPRFLPLRCVCHMVPVNDVDGGADGDGDGDDDYDHGFLYQCHCPGALPLYVFRMKTYY